MHSDLSVRSSREMAECAHGNLGDTQKGPENPRTGDFIQRREPGNPSTGRSDQPRETVNYTSDVTRLERQDMALCHVVTKRESTSYTIAKFEWHVRPRLEEEREAPNFGLSGSCESERRSTTVHLSNETRDGI